MGQSVESVATRTGRRPIFSWQGSAFSQDELREDSYRVSWAFPCPKPDRFAAAAPLDCRYHAQLIGGAALPLPLTTTPLTSSPPFDIFEPDDFETPVARLQPRARDVGGADLIAMNHGSILRIAGKKTLDAYFSLFDEFDIYNKGQLSATLEESVGSRAITIDLAHTTFIDASILGVLVRLAVRAREHNATQVRIVNASAHLRRLFSICQLEAIFDIEDRARA